MPDLRTNPLSAGDALFLYLERNGAPLSVAAIARFEGVIALEDFTAHLESKLPLIPRYLQRLVAPPFDIGLPTWEYDPEFDVRNHVQEMTLKHGTEAEFKAAVGRVLSSNLRRDRPLWDFTLVHGLKGNRTGMVIRIHHCLADGISGVGIMNTILDPSPDVQPPSKPVERFEAPPLRTPSITESIVKAFFNSVERALTIETDLLEMARTAITGQLHTEASTEGEPITDAAAALLPINDVSKMVLEFGSPTDRLPFNVVCRGPQKFNWAELPLAEMKAVKNVCGATINDVVLALFASSVRRYAELHGQELAGRVVRVGVPVNLRGGGEVTELGNRINFIVVNLPLDIADMRELVEAVHIAVARAKKAHTPELVALLGTLIETVPTPLQATLLPVLSQLPLSILNAVCTNVPGPKIPLYLFGHKMLSCYPYVPIGGEMGMNCAVLSYNDVVYFGFSGDAVAIPDLARLDKLLVGSFADLLKATGVHTKPKKKARAKKKGGSASATKVAGRSKRVASDSEKEKTAAGQTPVAPEAKAAGAAPAA
jgi:diacylglycerol O-acyltransferase / wax synthase